VSPAGGQLTGTVRAVRRHLGRRAAGAAVLWVGSGLAIFLAAAWLSVGSDGWRPGSNAPVLLDSLMLLWVLAGVGAFRTGTRTWFDEVPLARSIERAAGMGAGIVRGSLELSRTVPEGVSGSLAGQAIVRTASGLSGRPAAELAGDLGRRVALWTRRGMITAALGVVMLGALGLAGPDRAARAWAGVASPFATMVDPVPAPILVSPGTIEVMRGTDVRVEIDAQGRLAVDLGWQAAGDVAHTQRLDLVGGRASHIFEAVTAATEYHVETEDGGSTETFRIVPIDPLFVSDLVVGVEYPPHTGLESDEYRGDPPPLRLPVGARLSFEGMASRALSTAGLVDSLGARRVELEVEGTSFVGGWTPSETGTFEWVFVDGAGTPAEIQPEPLEILMVPDSVPSVAILLPGQDTVLPLSLRQPLVVDARDDYGLGRFELVAYRVTALGERHEPVVYGLELEGARAVLARPALDLSSWGLLPGDTVRYFARVIDNNPAAQTAVSPEYALRMPDVEELRREAEATLENVAERLDELRAQAERQAEASADRALQASAQRNPQAGPPPDADFEQREALRRALEEQTALLSEVDSLRADVDALRRAMEEAGQADPELAADLEELQELLRELAGEDLRERMEELAQALRDEDQARGNQSLEELAREQQAFQERLEAALEAFERAAVEQDFRATASDVEELARRERALADALRENDDPELRGEQQAALAQQAEELETRMDSLSARLAELNEQRAADGVQQARQQAAEARQQMREAERQARRGDSQAASQQAAQAADQMQQAADQMQQAQDGMAEQSAQQARAALEQAADDALSLARRQDDLRDRMQNASEDALTEMRGDQASLLRGLQNMADNLQAGTQATGGDPAMSAQMGRAMEAMQGAIQSLEARTPSSSSAAARAEQAVGSLNQLALMAIAGAEQAGQTGAGQSGQDVARQVGQLAQRQGELVSQTGQLAPMRLGEQAMAQQLSGLSERQESVARDLQDVSQEPGAGDALGDLEQLAREADLLAEQLAQGRLTPEVVQRQERLFHRLLDAGRSLEREEFSEDRESERPGIFERGDVMPLSAAQLGLMPYELPDGVELRRLSPAVRQLVLEYFDRLNRAPPGEGPR
jgi:hypothetical protein